MAAGARTLGHMRVRGAGQAEPHERMREAHRLFCEGMSAKAVARHMRIGEETARNWIYRVDDWDRALRARGSVRP